MTAFLPPTNWFIAHEALLRGGCFLTVFTLIAVWELRAPARALTRPKPIRWANNLALMIVDTIVVRLLFPSATVGVAVFATEQQWGVLNAVSARPWVGGIVTIVVLDFTIWLQHVAVHAIPVLWRIHRVHHADPDYDLTTGTRFHPFEIVLSMLVKFTAIVILGPPVIAVIAFEALLNATAVFNHGNLRLAAGLDRALRVFVVTPDMHRVHHSQIPEEANSNFGFNLPWWDRLFGTYREHPAAGHPAMEIGLRGWTDAREVMWIGGLLRMPFRSERDTARSARADC